MNWTRVISRSILLAATPIIPDDSRDQFIRNKQQLQKINYQNRIRSYSTQDKVFRLFATIQVKSATSRKGVVYMTVEDFVRSITPGNPQPTGLGLDSYNTLRTEQVEKFMKNYEPNISDDCILMKISKGLVNFQDYTVDDFEKQIFELKFA